MSPAAEPFSDAAAWVAALARGWGLAEPDPTLLQAAADSFERAGGGAAALARNLTLSFCAAAQLGPDTLRWVIQAGELPACEAGSLIGTGRDLLLRRPTASAAAELERSPAFHRFSSVVDGTGGHLVYGIGAEHVADGTLASFKTYWRFPSPFDELRRLLPPGLRAQFEQLLSGVQASWPEMRNAALTGIDLLASGRIRFKAYLPQKDLIQPLSLVELCAFLLTLGWRVDLQAFPIVSQILLGGRPQVEPTAYLLGLAIDSRPAVKLEIAAEAYFAGTAQALEAACKLARALGCDPQPLHAQVTALLRRSPHARKQAIDTICLDFYPDGANRIIVYCGA